MTQDGRVPAGEWLRRERERRNISARKIAARFDVSTQAVNGWESGRYSFATDERADGLAEMFHMNVIEVRRNLGMWVPPAEQPDHEESDVEDALERILAADRTQLSTEELIDRIGKLMDLAREYIRYVQDESA